jgi:hypothetical protein
MSRPRTYGTSRVNRSRRTVAEILEIQRAIKHDEKPTYIYHFGDHDPSGVLIDGQIERGLRRLAPDAEIHFCRLAVTPEQIEAWRLPTRPTKREGNSHAKGFDGQSVELDAIPAHQVRQLAREAISRHVDARALHAVQTAEASELDVLRRLANRELKQTFARETAAALVDQIKVGQAALRRRWDTIADAVEGGS